MLVQAIQKRILEFKDFILKNIL